MDEVEFGAEVCQMADSEGSIRLNPDVDKIVCSMTGKAYDPHGFNRPIGLCSCCPAPGKPLVVVYKLEEIRERIEKEGWGNGPGIWRYGAVLPVLGLPWRYAPDVGLTRAVRHEALGGMNGVDLYLKNEGSNPSGSFKDRGLAVGIALGVACGAKRFCLPTQGNAGVASSLFSTRLNLPGCLVYMPEGYQGNIYHREAEFFGAEVRFAGDNIAASGKIMRDAFADELASGELVDMSTFFEPGRLEGKKTMGFEIVENFGRTACPTGSSIRPVEAPGWWGSGRPSRSWLRSVAWIRPSTAYRGWWRCSRITVRRWWSRSNAASTTWNRCSPRERSRTDSMSLERSWATAFWPQSENPTAPLWRSANGDRRRVQGPRQARPGRELRERGGLCRPAPLAHRRGDRCRRQGAAADDREPPHFARTATEVGL